MVKGIINAFDHVEFCLVINLRICGNSAVTWPPMIDAKYVSFATALITRLQVLVTHRRSKFLSLKCKVYTD